MLALKTEAVDTAGPEKNTSNIREIIVPHSVFGYGKQREGETEFFTRAEIKDPDVADARSGILYIDLAGVL